MSYEDKYSCLIENLKKLDSVVVAFSGGVDSTFLMQVAKEALGDKVMAITIESPYMPKWEIEEAKALAIDLSIRHTIVEEGLIDEIKYNPENRCYLCKKAIFQNICDIAQKNGYKYVVDGTNYDDIKDYRPGIKALNELNVKSPLKDCEITKEEIRMLSKEKNLATWDKPAYACLLTRIPYGIQLKEEMFIKIEKAETALMDLGFRAIRVRCHGNLARIELHKDDIKKMIIEDLTEEVSEKVREAGFTYITLDIDGYKMGSFNKMLQ